MLVRALCLVVVDIFLILLAMTGALMVRFDFRFSSIDPIFLDSTRSYAVINIVCTIIIFYVFNLYITLWRFASTVEMRNTVAAVLLSAIAQYIGMRIMGLPIPRSYAPIYFILLGAGVVLVRFSYRTIRIAKHNYIDNRKMPKVRTMVVGAGAAGYMIVREMKNSKHLKCEVPCIIDDDPQKKGTRLHGIPVVGRSSEIPKIAEEYQIEEIVIAIPTLGGEKRKELLEICQHTNCKIKILPGIYQMVNEEVSVSMLRDVQIEELLGRDPVNLKNETVMNYVRGKTVLVTGGGGSIGSEICRQIVLAEPKQLLIFDCYENNAYEIQNEIRSEHPEANLVTIIGSVRDKGRVDEVFEKYHPQLVFHAAAHKHVPLMEESPHEAIKNNVLGTLNVAEAAKRFGAEHMVLISTDKAVRPTNIMGASKRICEMIIQGMSQHSETIFAAVRFGNVLGSNGSVIPIFRKQIAAGGPVTVTHPDIIRYFMTIPEAVSLVLQCGALSKGGEVFLLDMGEPVKILDLAKKMIYLSGLKPEEDIKIVFTGLRPGEKLYEELLIEEDNLTQTEKAGIYVATLPPVEIDDLKGQIEELRYAAYNEGTDIKELVAKVVPEYTPWEETPEGTGAFSNAAEEAKTVSSEPNTEGPDMKQSHASSPAAAVPEAQS